jgi:hypothetical protein
MALAKTKIMYVYQIMMYALKDIIQHKMMKQVNVLKIKEKMDVSMMV